jgi:hypothetical protein
MLRRSQMGRVVPALAAAMVLAAVAGCGPGNPGVLVGNLRPEVDLTARPEPLDSVYYAVRLQWSASDADGRVNSFVYAVDPPMMGDTTWISHNRYEITLFFRSSGPDSSAIKPSPSFPPVDVRSYDYHTFVLKAVDNEGATSPPETITFTSQTIAPVTNILEPSPTSQSTASTTPSVTIRWVGQDQDGLTTQRPVKYKFRLASEGTIKAALGLTVAPNQVALQRFFGADAPEFAAWDSVPADSASKSYEGLTPGQIWFFAVTAIDEAGAYEPRFNLNNNLLRFRPSRNLLAPPITIFNTFFERTQPFGQFSLLERDVVRIETPSDESVTFNWFATPVTGTVITGYRWVLDPVDGDIFNETPRENEEQTYRWSSWSVSQTQAIVGPFFTQPGQDEFHRFYLEARDNVGAISIMIVEFKVVKPSFTKDLLVVDDYRGPPDGPTGQPGGVYPSEAILDTLLVAVGGMPYKARPAGTLSDPGVFAGYQVDTLDYRAQRLAGVSLSTLGRYKAVAWYASTGDASRTGDFDALNPSGALRFVNTLGELNTLAVYLSQRGHVLLFGEGMIQSIANGYATRFGVLPAPFPYDRSGDRPARNDILYSGNFLFDFMKLNADTEVRITNPQDLSKAGELHGMTPYLPANRTPGAPWPPTGWTGGRGPTDDPRVGPSSERNVPRWDGLPTLTITTEFPNWPGGVPQSTPFAPFIARPLFHLEPGLPPDAEPRLDTLYLYRANEYNLSPVPTNADGKPIWLHYWGGLHGEVSYVSAPIWYFERTQLQQVVERVLRRFGLQKISDPRRWTGPGSAHDPTTRREGT